MPEFTMQAVTNETGVPGDTLRSWERRYGFPRPSRDESNYRIYTERDIVAAAWLRDQTRRGQGISEAISRLQGILETAPEELPSPATALVPDTSLTDALLTGDVAAAQATWDRLALAMSLEGLVEHVLLPAHRRVFSVDLPLTTRLHATSFLLRKAIVLFDGAGPDTGSRDIAILTSGASTVAVPAYGLATVLARAGYRVHGAIGDLHDAATLAALHDLAPQTLVIVVTDRPDAGLIDATAAIVGTNALFLWWPYPSPEQHGDRWLPHSIAEVHGRLPDRA